MDSRSAGWPAWSDEGATRQVSTVTSKQQLERRQPRRGAAPQVAPSLPWIGGQAPC
jgi:hypothetical protein